MPHNDPRVPPSGATLTRVVGERRCECRIETDGFRYGGKLYPSLSAAASAAAREVGLNPSQNGFIFWGLIQPSAARTPASSMTARWKQYEAALRRALGSRAAEAIRREALAHLAVLRELLKMSGGDRNALKDPS